MRTGLILVATLSAGCFTDRVFLCESDDQCLAAPSGICEAERWCSYPDDGCEGGRAYGPYAPPDVAGACIPAPDPDEPAPVLCGNGVVDPGEECDDGNRLPGDDCHPLCVSPSGIAWTATYDGQSHGQDRGFALTIDAPNDAIYLTGITTPNPDDDDDWDILLQRWRLETGELLWTREIGSTTAGEDRGEQVALDPDGNVVVVGTMEHGTADSTAWLAKYDPDGNALWVGSPPAEASVAAGVAVTAQGRIVVVGEANLEDQDRAWIQWFSADGEPDSAPVIRDDLGDSRAIDVIAEGDRYQVTGSSVQGEDEYVWTALHAFDDTVIWEDLMGGGDLGHGARGVGQAFDPRGGSAMTGVANGDVLVQRYDDAGMVVQTLTEEGPAQMHDEGADLAFRADGSFIVVGLLDFATVGFATSDSWIRLYDATGEPVWTDLFDGEAQEIDKALAVELTEHSAVVVGYETVPGQQRDVWMRRYAI